MKKLLNTLAFLFIVVSIASLDAMKPDTSYHDLLPTDLKKELIKFQTNNGNSAASYFWLLKEQKRRNFNCNPILTIENAGSEAHFNQNADRIIAILQDKSAQVYDIKTRACLQRLKCGTEMVEEARLNACGDKAITASRMHRNDKKCTIRIWDVASGKCLKELPSMDNCKNIQLNAKETQIITVPCVGYTKIWDIESGECLHTLRDLPSALYPTYVDYGDTDSAELSNSGDIITTVKERAYEIKFWKLEDGKIFSLFSTDIYNLKKATLNKTNDKLIGLTRGCQAYIWNYNPLKSNWAYKHKPICKISLEKNMTMRNAKFNNTESVIIAVEGKQDCDCSNTGASLYDIQDGYCVAEVNEGIVMDIPDNLSKVATFQYGLFGDREYNIYEIVNAGLKEEIFDSLTSTQAAILERAYQCAKNKQSLVLSSEECKEFDESPLREVIRNTIKVERSDAQKKIQKLINLGMFAGAGLLLYKLSK